MILILIMTVSSVPVTQGARQAVPASWWPPAFLVADGSGPYDPGFTAAPGGGGLGAEAEQVGHDGGRELAGELQERAGRCSSRR
jgi:hypothetical protein